MAEPDVFYSKLAFYLSLGFWIPLFNIAICIVSSIIALIAIKKKVNDPKAFGGLGWAVTALIISLSGIILTIVGLVVYLLSPDICGSLICQNYSAGLL